MLATIEMRLCPFCGSDDLDAQFWAAQKEEDGPIVRGPGCFSCDATAASVEAWNTRPKFDESPFALITYRSDLA